MTVATVAKILCGASVPVAVFAHVSLFYIGWPFDYRVIGLIAVAAGLAGIVARSLANRGRLDTYLPRWHLLIALTGILVGLFYASTIGPFILFFPRI